MLCALVSATCSRLCCNFRQNCTSLNIYPVIITLYISCTRFSTTVVTVMAKNWEGGNQIMFVTVWCIASTISNHHLIDVHKDLPTVLTGSANFSLCACLWWGPLYKLFQKFWLHISYILQKHLPPILRNSSSSIVGGSSFIGGTIGVGDGTRLRAAAPVVPPPPPSPRNRGALRGHGDEHGPIRRERGSTPHTCICIQMSENWAVDLGSACR